MAISDPVADMLTKIRNASMAKHEKVEIPTSKLKLQIVKILKNEGYVKNFKKVVNKDGVNTIRVFLKYDEKQNPVLHGIDRISTPGRRVYSGYRDMPRVYNGYGVVVVSTSSGIITGKKASEKKVGGELICSIW
ncbi:MAG: 30S ribosomal protein S8 [Spirochaetae bacterium HGW-Spirochaetae-4]|jgi:small subunit ribosomal protein S8|nr:30S ribosomal protein S8 [Sphaerochaeta sp.]OHD31744.1 MAG: 30S ribosomal protein S8 [Spirochaetes bacterium GWC2_52_13]OHD68229.1 MAG: 30S ribosomal protein S8 [Spirochaetes bacterium GWF2_52_7]PKL22690.1 MAG: 30S ribosomal protein S8 [Spirochaetae bacterium HGW-Spirochaetae-4]PKL27497.1 MAG: 30S ribosomal protein S8 [Spirochaetae bacterium HGW-Spirochaetae-2]